MVRGVPAIVPLCVRSWRHAQGTGQAEVSNLDALDAVLQQDVGRLVSMH